MTLSRAAGGDAGDDAAQEEKERVEKMLGALYAAQPLARLLLLLLRLKQSFPTACRYTMSPEERTKRSFPDSHSSARTLHSTHSAADALTHSAPFAGPQELENLERALS